MRVVPVRGFGRNVAALCCLISAALAAPPASAAADDTSPMVRSAAVSDAPSVDLSREVVITTVGAQGRPEVTRWQTPSRAEAQGIAEAWARRHGVLSAEVNTEYRAAVAPNGEPGYPSQWGLSRTGAPAAWAMSTGSGVRVAVVDTGVDATHPDLLTRVLAGTDRTGAGTDGRVDGNGHGTHVAGIVAAAINGVGIAGAAPDAAILPIRVLNAQGVGDTASVAQGIYDAVALGARVINLSLGSTDSSSTVNSAISYARASGSLVVAAGGNFAQSGNPVVYPAAAPGVMAVASTSTGDARSAFSSQGWWIDLAAPGDSILSTTPGGGFQYRSGSSMAAPLVSATGALIWGARPDLSVDEVEGFIRQNAEDLGAPGWDPTFGAGLVRPDRAVTAASTPTVWLAAEGPNGLPEAIEGQPVKLRASVVARGGAQSGLAGAVSFSQGGVALGTASLVAGAAALSTSTLPVGRATVIASYLPATSPWQIAQSSPSEVAMSRAGGRFTPVNPARILDTRLGVGAPSARLSPGNPVRVQVAGRAGVPSNAQAAILNVTVTDPIAAGHLTVYPCGALPSTSNLNFVAGQTVANLVASRLSADGSICLSSPTATHVVIDVSGQHPFGGAGYTAIEPVRLLDTRSSAGRVPGGTTRAVRVSGLGVIPAGVAATTLNVTVTEPTGSGHLTVYPCDQPRPTASNVNYAPGQTVPNAVVARGDAAGYICIYTTTTTHLIVDGFGWHGIAGEYRAMSPVRTLDSRIGSIAVDGSTRSAAAVAAGQVVEVPVVGAAAAPGDASAVTLNITATQSSGGYLTVFPCGQSRPLASALNPVAGVDVANLTVTPVGAGGRVCVYSSNATHLVVDVQGYFL